MYNFAFILDQQVGLRTQALNFEQVVSRDRTISPSWTRVCYQADGGPLSRLPGLPSAIRGTLRGIREIRDGVGDMRRFDAAVWATWAAKSVPDLVGAAPAFLIMDMTPIQMEAMGRLYGYSSARARFLGGWKRRAVDRLYRQAAHLFPWNEWVAASLRDDYGVPAEKITPISPGVDTDLYRPNLAAGRNDGVTRLLFVGGDFARKGGDLLLRWAWQRQAAVPTEPWELHLVTRDTVPDLPPGVFVHHNLANNSPELIRLYQQSDIFVLPTRADCYSLVALEAMAVGIPVVISDIGGISTIVSESETGFLIPPNDFDALEERLRRLVSNLGLRREMGKASRERACAHFDCRANLARILEAMKAASTTATSPTLRH